MRMIDMSGQPRSDEDLQEAIDAVGVIMVKHSLELPLFTIHAGTIRQCLLELQCYRKIIKEANKGK